MWRSAGLAGDAQAETKEEFVKVKRRDLERLTTEVMQLRDFLPKIVNGDILGTFQKLDAIESNLEKKEEEIEQLRMDCEHFRARLETAQADCMREKKEKLDLRQQLNEAKQQLLQQAEYCTEMGAAVCTLLWGVSSNEEAVKSILGGSKAVKFFTITAQTMESFVKSLSEDMKQQDLDSEENQFVLALAGIVTNVAALACGREFLVSSSRELLDTMMHLLGDMKPGLCNKFKVLMLMSLYNVSINMKGLKYISESPGFIPLLWWLLNENVAAQAFHEIISCCGMPQALSSKVSGNEVILTRTQRFACTPCGCCSRCCWSPRCWPGRAPRCATRCPCSASSPCPRAATQSCRPWPKNSSTTLKYWTTKRRRALRHQTITSFLCFYDARVVGRLDLEKKTSA
ncbi:heat shock factor 2-binding protein isoform 2-T2 [Acridotheres tristis]